ncbi:MAG: hypothetical protein ABSF64_05455 [Bryobacteraceae bacterium]|jgi:hypothetical protein
MKKLLVLPCLAAALMAADVSGTWKGNVVVDDPTSGSTVDTQVRAELRQKADAVTGTIGRQEDQEGESIKNAKLDGKRLTFEVSSAEASGLIKFELALDGDRLEGEMSGTMDGTAIAGKVHLKRAPPH